MFDEERLDPHGVGNLPRVLTMSTVVHAIYGVRGRVESVYFWCVSRVPVYFWFIFQTKEEAVNSSWKYVDESRRSCRIADWIYVFGKRATKQHEGVCPLPSIIKEVKEQIAEARSLGIKSVSLLGINFHGFSSAKLYQQRKSRLHVVMKKFAKFSREIWASKVHTFGEI